jgi:hypothetical protein
MRSYDMRHENSSLYTVMHIYTYYTYPPPSHPGTLVGERIYSGRCAQKWEVEWTAFIDLGAYVYMCIICLLYVCMCICVLYVYMCIIDVLYAICYMLYPICYMLYAVCYMLYAICCTLNPPPLPMTYDIPPTTPDLHTHRQHH